MTTPLKRSNVRYGILLFLFLATVFNYADRATLSVVAPIMSKELGFDPEAMGLAFSVFGISYVIMQIPGGWLLDKYGSRLVYGCALIGWSVVTMFQGTIYLFASPLIVLVILRLMMGAIEAPAFPANSRLSVQWFPNKERGFVTSVYQAAQYISLGIITPLMTISPPPAGTECGRVPPAALRVVSVVRPRQGSRWYEYHARRRASRRHSASETARWPPLR